MLALRDRFPMFHVLRFPPFTLLWSGQTISALGNNMYRVALGWMVLQLTGSALAMGEVYIATLIPTIVLSLIGGVTADRVSRRTVLLVSDGGRGLAVSLVAVLGWFHLLQVWHILVLALLFGIADSFFSPAYRAIRQQLVAREYLQVANALVEASTLFCRFTGPVLGALCLVTIGAASTFALDALSFLLSALCLLFMRVPSRTVASEQAKEGRVASPSFHEKARQFLLEIREGFTYVFASSWLLVGITVAALVNSTFFAPLATALPKLVSTFYHAGPWLLGGLLAAEAVGSLAGNFFAGSARHLQKRGLVAYTALAISSVGLLALGLPLARIGAPFAPLLASIIAGGGFGVFTPVWETLLQELVPENMLGRVCSIDMLGSYALLPAGLIVVGFCTDRFGPALVFVGGGLLTLCLAGAALCMRDIRRVA